MTGLTQVEFSREMTRYTQDIVYIYGGISANPELRKRIKDNQMRMIRRCPEGLALNGFYVEEVEVRDIESENPRIRVTGRRDES